MRAYPHRGSVSEPRPISSAAPRGFRLRSVSHPKAGTSSLFPGSSAFLTKALSTPKATVTMRAVQRSTKGAIILVLTAQGGRHRRERARLNREEPHPGVDAAAVLGLTAAAVLGLCVPTLAEDAAQLEAGEQAWVTGGCGACHGNEGQGGTDPDSPVGPSLRTGALDHDGLVEAISCGRPGTTMAAWLEGAYTVSACYGGDLGPPPARTRVVGLFSVEEIEALVDYITVEFIKK